MENKQELLHVLEISWKMEQEFAREVPSKERERTGTQESWSAKDLLAHISAWKSRAAENIRAVQDGREPLGGDDFDHQNEQFFHQYRDLSWDEVQELAEQAYQDLTAAVSSLDLEDLNRVGYFPWLTDPLWRNLIGTGATHPMIHLSEYHQQAGNAVRAGEIIEVMTAQAADLSTQPAYQATILYNLACAKILQGKENRALDPLRRAFRLHPDLQTWAEQDSDLDPIRDLPGFKKLLDN